MRVASIVLWLAATLLLATNGIILLFARDFRIPSVLSQQRRFCPAPVDTSALARERARKDQLETRMTGLACCQATCTAF